MSVFVANESGHAVDTEELAGLLRFCLDDLGVHPQAEVSLLAVDLQAMSDLHQQWMDEAGPTDVMSFPMDELTERGSWEAEPSRPGPALLGDIVICPQFARTQADERGHPLQHELRILVAHGLLHLLGYDHAEPEEQTAMFARQERLVADWEKR